MGRHTSAMLGLGWVALGLSCADLCGGGEADCRMVGPLGTPGGATGGTAGGAARVTLEPAGAVTGCPAGRYYVNRVQGRMVDMLGRPLARAQVNVCGNACIPGTADNDGRFDIAVDLCFGTNAEYPHGAVLWYSGNRRYADLFFDFNPRGMQRVGLARIETPLAVPALADGGNAYVPSGSRGIVRMVDGLGFSLTISPDNIEYPLTAEDETVRVVRMDPTRMPFAAEDRPDVMYAIEPADSRLREPAPAEFPNTLRLAPGTEVDIVGVGNHISRGRPATGTLGRIDMGHVSDDGRTVVPDHGLRFLGMVGWRALRR